MKRRAIFRLSLRDKLVCAMFILVSTPAALTMGKLFFLCDFSFHHSSKLRRCCNAIYFRFFRFNISLANIFGISSSFNGRKRNHSFNLFTDAELNSTR